MHDESRIRIRTLAPDDHQPVTKVVNEWWGGRQVAPLLQKVFFMHFCESSFLAESEDDLVGFLVEFLSPTRADEAYIHFVGVNPRFRKHGVGRRLSERFFQVARLAKRHRVCCVTSPVSETSIAFHQKMGFRLCGEPQGGAAIPIHRDYDGPGEDRVLMARHL